MASEQLPLEGEVETSRLPVKVKDTPKPVVYKPINVEHLLEMAIDKGIDVEAMEKLVTLGERVADRNARTEYFAALAAFQDECPAIERKTTGRMMSTAKGTAYEYKYAQLQEIMPEIAGPLRKNNLSVNWNTREDQNRLIVSCTCKHTAGHSESSEFPVPTATRAGMSDQQKYSSALMTGMRQSLIQVLGIYTANPDLDGQEGADSSKISETQVADIRALIDEVGAEEVRVCAFASVKELEDLEVSQYRMVINLLEKKRGKK